MPIALPTPCPSGPVLISTPGVELIPRSSSGCPGVLRPPLTELLQVVHREVVAGEVQRGVLQDAGVPGREHEAVAVGPGRVGWVVAHALAVEDVGDRRERHGGARVTGVGLLHRVHGEAADGVDRERLDVGGHTTPRGRNRRAGTVAP